MKAKKQLVNKLIISLQTEKDKWEIDSYMAINKEWKVKIWIANGLISASLHEPHKISFGLFDRIKLRKALLECICLKITETNKAIK